MVRSKLVAWLEVAGRRVPMILLGFALCGVGCGFPSYGFGGEGGAAGQGPDQERCGNGKDDDKDGKIDCEDSDCKCVDAGTETACNNGVDDDKDGKTDCEDSDCHCTETDCANGEDDDKDGKIDCEDSDCKCVDAGTETACNNGVDDDKDGKTDCEDSDCHCTETDCANGKDDDKDGKIDCEDSDCHCTETDCANGKDDDKDGKIDCEDSDCVCPVLENCANGKDDDKDGKIDCEDDECVCVPAVPEGWDGPAVIWYGSRDLEPTCSAAGAYRAVVHDLGCEFSEPAWECPECQCGAPEGAACSARITYFSGEDCSGGCWPLGSSDCGYDVGPTCEGITLNYGGVDNARPVSASIELSAPTGGECLPQTSSPVEPPDVSWDQVLLACAGAPVGGLGCDAAQTCVPRPPVDPFDRICVYAEGDSACPPSYEASRTTAYGDLDDSRGCADCGCAAPTGIQCTGTVTDYVSRQHCGETENVIGAGQCVAIPPQSEGSEDFRHVLFEDSTSGGTCTATGGEKTGSVEPTEPVTFCCLGLW